MTAVQGWADPYGALASYLASKTNPTDFDKALSAPKGKHRWSTTASS